MYGFLCIFSCLILLLVVILKYTTVFPNLQFLRKHNQMQQYEDLGNSQWSINLKSHNGIHKYDILYHYDFYLLYTFLDC